MLPVEILVHVIEVGCFSRQEILRLRCVNKALCAAASCPSWYRDHEIYFEQDEPPPGCSRLGSVPAFVAASLRRLTLRNPPTREFDLVAGLFPGLTSLSVKSFDRYCDPWALARCSGLREVDLALDPGLGLDGVSQLDRLESLSLSHVVTPAVPVASLPNLRRLTLTNFRADPAGLMAALVAAPCAPTLEALRLTFVTWGLTPSADETVTAGWWAGLVDLTGLCELCLRSHFRACLTADDDADGFAAVLAGLDRLAVLEFVCCETATQAVMRHGLPPRLQALMIVPEGPDFFETLIPQLPPSLFALSAESEDIAAVHVQSLLSQCPRLGAIAVDGDYEAFQVLAAAAKSHGVLRVHNTGRDLDWLEQSAGHRLGPLRVTVSWRTPGGVFFGGNAVPYPPP